MTKGPAGGDLVAGASVALDATWPPEWPRDGTPVRATLDSMYAPEVQRRVLERWASLGLK